VFEIMMAARGQICVSISASDARAAARIVAPLAPLVDVVEIRLDAMQTPDVAACMELISLPLLFTNRPAWEGGAFAGSEEERIEPLVAAARLGAAYVDLELRADISFRDQLHKHCRASGCGLILSWHDFSTTPSTSRLNSLVREMEAADADIGKVVTTASNTDDVIRVLSLLSAVDAKRMRLSAFCMGEVGRISRFATLYLGGAMTYVAPDEQSATAPGQFSARQLADLLTTYSHAD
jgi:3-dehydroquinate dehydratase-1/3-dehydroquinate dehydratase/shikimate dehydrogenase